MAKPNNMKMESRYVKQQQQKHGFNFIGAKTAKDLYREMPRIISELANGYLDINEQGYWFTSNQFIEASLTYLTDQINLLNVLIRNYGYYQSMVYGQMQEYDIGLLQKMCKKHEAYCLIYNTMLIVRNTSSYEPLKRLQVDLNKIYRGFLQTGVVI